MIKPNLIEIHVVFERPKSENYLQAIANNLVRVVQDNVSAHFAVQRPRVYVADIRDSEDDDA